MFAPHHAVNAKFGIGRRAPKPLADSIKFVCVKTKFLCGLHGNGDFRVQVWSGVHGNKAIIEKIISAQIYEHCAQHENCA
jgi:hypothetical protein